MNNTIFNNEETLSKRVSLPEINTPESLGRNKRVVAMYNSLDELVEKLDKLKNEENQQNKSEMMQSDNLDKEDHSQEHVFLIQLNNIVPVNYTIKQIDVNRKLNKNDITGSHNMASVDDNQGSGGV